MAQKLSVKSKKRAIIIETTQQLLLRYGVDKTSIRDISKEAKVSQVTIYNHFEDKDDLIHVAVKELIDKYMVAFEDTITSEDGFEQKLKNLLLLRKDINITKTWFSLVSLAKKDKFIAKVLEDIYEKKQRNALLKLIKQGKAEGIIDAKISEEALSIYIKMFKDYYFEPDNALLFTTNETLIYELWALFWNGISGK